MGTLVFPSHQAVHLPVDPFALGAILRSDSCVGVRSQCVGPVLLGGVDVGGMVGVQLVCVGVGWGVVLLPCDIGSNAFFGRFHWMLDDADVGVSCRCVAHGQWWQRGGQPIAFGRRAIRGRGAPL